VDLCTLSFASVGVHAIEASARFHGAVAGMRMYLLAAKASVCRHRAVALGGPQGGRRLPGFKLRRPKDLPSTLEVTPMLPVVALEYRQRRPPDARRLQLAGIG
jgi:hypothetical protein